MRFGLIEASFGKLNLNFMNKFKYFWVVIVMGLFSTFSSDLNAETENIYSYSGTLLNGQEFDLSSLEGRVTLIVNTASKCGFTSQYKGLEELYDTYSEKGLMVLGFPSNDFGAQEPGSNDDIANFCRINYGVSFPMFKKDSVKGETKQKIYKALTDRSGEEFAGDPGWNFVKFLVDKKGRVRARFSSMLSPTSKTITQKVEELLAE